MQSRPRRFPRGPRARPRPARLQDPGGPARPGNAHRPGAWALVSPCYLPGLRPRAVRGGQRARRPRGAGLRPHRRGPSRGRASDDPGPDRGEASWGAAGGRHRGGAAIPRCSPSAWARAAAGWRPTPAPRSRAPRARCGARPRGWPPTLLECAPEDIRIEAGHRPQVAGVPLEIHPPRHSSPTRPSSRKRS